MPRFPTFSTSNLVFRMPNFQFSTLDASLFFRLEPHYISHYIKCRSRNKLGECRVFVFGSSYLVKKPFLRLQVGGRGKTAWEIFGTHAFRGLFHFLLLRLYFRWRQEGAKHTQEFWCHIVLSFRQLRGGGLCEFDQKLFVPLVATILSIFLLSPFIYLLSPVAFLSPAYAIQFWKNLEPTTTTLFLQSSFFLAKNIRR